MSDNSPSNLDNDRLEADGTERDEQLDKSRDLEGEDDNFGTKRSDTDDAATVDDQADGDDDAVAEPGE